MRAKVTLLKKVTPQDVTLGAPNGEMTLVPLLWASVQVERSLNNLC